MTNLDTAKQILTPAEYDAWILRHRGMSQRNIALALGITRWAARDRIDAATAKLADHHAGRRPAA